MKNEWPYQPVDQGKDSWPYGPEGLLIRCRTLIVGVLAS